VSGLVRRPLDLSIQDLQRMFPARTVPAVMQCAGNRRADLQAVQPTSGDPWGPGAIGHARWSGVALADVLAEAGADTAGGLHVAFEACDVVDMPDEGRFTFGVSIPMRKAVSADVLLATHMNGEELSPEHGFPLRAVVPGFAGVRSAKWLRRVVVQAAPSGNHMQQRDYRLLPPDVTEATVDWDLGTTIYEMPLTSAICEPVREARLPAGNVLVRGYALASGRDVARVDVSADGGRTWCQAALERGEGSEWSWVFWHATLVLAAGRHELAVRAWDSAGQTQPARPEDVWNFKGYLSAAWHQVSVSAI
jgi:sulfite oxidase